MTTTDTAGGELETPHRAIPNTSETDTLRAEEDLAWSEWLASESEFWRAQAMLVLGDEAA